MIQNLIPWIVAAGVANGAFLFPAGAEGLAWPRGSTADLSLKMLTVPHSFRAPCLACEIWVADLV